MPRIRKSMGSAVHANALPVSHEGEWYQMVKGIRYARILARLPRQLYQLPFTTGLCFTSVLSLPLKRCGSSSVYSSQTACIIVPDPFSGLGGATRTRTTAATCT